MVFGFGHKKKLPSPAQALPGRDQEMSVPTSHFVNGRPLKGPFKGMSSALFGMGCFWGAERKFWQTTGIFTTAVGYAAGQTKNPNYQEVCSGRTGHNEVVLVVYDAEELRFEELLKVFWESHNPTQGMRQGNDVGTQYRSGIYVFTDEQRLAAQQSKELYQEVLNSAAHGAITTEIVAAPEFYYAEEYHQQYLAKNPGGYCGLGGLGASCPIGIAKAE
jgi:peptide-methionine (S)-S-oxide reductase